MYRKLILASAFSIALLPEVSEALGLGGIRSQSALNEAFVGEIELLDVNPDQLDTVKARLAPVAEFSRAGTELSGFLNSLRFRPQVSPQGRTVIRVTSADPVREPFLDFLVEVTWPKGRLVKEYTVLLDPPVTDGRRPPSAELPSATRPRAEQDSRARPSSRRTGGSPAASAPEQGQGGSTTAGFPLRYGPIASGEGLRRIALRLAPAGATVAQTAMALYRNNQHAFIGADIDRIRVGQHLQIPTEAELFALDPAAAEREFNAAMRGERVTAAPLTDVSAAPAAKDRLKIAAPPKPEAETDAVAPSSQSDEREPALGAIQDELLLVQEAGESTRQETQELRERVRELEAHLADIRRLLELRNEQLAALQGFQSVGMGQPAGEAAGTETDEPISAPVEVSRAPRAEKTPEVDHHADSPPSGASTVSSEKPTEESPPPSPEESEPAFSESVAHSRLGLWMALLFLLLSLGWLVIKRLRGLEGALTGADLARGELGLPDARGGITEPALAAEKAQADSLASESSLALRVQYSGFGELGEEPEETDILSEADVYIEYGRYREAESLLTEEIAKSPDRLDLKYKLADAYFGARNLDALRRLAEDLRRIGADRLDLHQWQRLTTLLSDLESAEWAAGTGRVKPGAVAREGTAHFKPPPRMQRQGIRKSASEAGFSMTASQRPSSGSAQREHFEDPALAAEGPGSLDESPYLSDQARAPGRAGHVLNVAKVKP